MRDESRYFRGSTPGSYRDAIVADGSEPRSDIIGGVAKNGIERAESRHRRRGGYVDVEVEHTGRPRSR